MTDPLALLLLGLLAVLLLVAAWEDIRARTIGNGLNAAIALVAPLWWWATGLALWPDIAAQLGCALAVFAVFAGMFAFGAMGGGDVKLLTVLALWFPPIPLLRLLFVMAIAGGVLTLLMVAIHAARRAAGRPEIPYGVAIAAAALFGMANDILTIPLA